MSNRLPAGQPAMQGGVSGGGAPYGGQPQFDMAGNVGHSANGGPSPVPPAQHPRQHRGPRQAQYQHHQSYYQQSPYGTNNIYNPYMAHYSASTYGYPPQPFMSHQYGQSAGMYQGPYVPYQQQPQIYTSQPPMPQAPYQHSPSMPPYAMNQSQPINAPIHSPFSQPPLPMVPTSVAPPTLPPTPASHHSSQLAPPSKPPTVEQPAEIPTKNQTYVEASINGDAAVESDQSQQPTPLHSEADISSNADQLTTEGPIPTPNPRSIWGALPWSTHENEPWPKRKKHKKKKAVSTIAQDVAPQQSQDAQNEVLVSDDTTSAQDSGDIEQSSTAVEVSDESVTEEMLSNVADDALMTSTPEPSSQPSAPSTAQKTSIETTPTPSSKPVPRTAVPAIPVVPALPKESPADSGKAGVDSVEPKQKPVVEPQESIKTPDISQESKPSQPPVFKNWAAVARGSAAAKAAAIAQSGTNGVSVSGKTGSPSGQAAIQGAPISNTGALAEVLKSYRARNNKVTFIEPRGLNNSGVDCYMNSILQVLLFCTPFYGFLDQVKRHSALSIRNNTPLLEALIWFHDQFRVIDSAPNPEQLIAKLKSEDYQQFGKPFWANHFYDAAFRLEVFTDRFKPGKQQDAGEFLTSLFERLQTECAKVIESAGDSRAHASSPGSFRNLEVNGNDEASGDWTTVEHRQRSAVTRSSGPRDVPTPLTSIFNGLTRSELRAPGRKDVITDEQFQSLNLYIEDPSIKNLLDALKWYSMAQTLKDSQFETPRGPVSGTQQHFLHALPSVLIIQLMRFEQVSNDRYQKLGKKVGYPLELEIPAGVLSRQRRNEYSAGKGGLPRYRLMAVVYHHGSNMDHGHYSVDVRRQDGREWIRINDTQITPITSDEVAEMGGEDVAGKAIGASRDTGADGVSGNRFAAMGDDDSADNGGDWKQVGSATNGNKKSSNAVNGRSSGTSTPRGASSRDNKDNKVAYLLFYDKI